MYYLTFINPKFLCEFYFQQIALIILIIHLYTRIHQRISTITYSHFSEHWYRERYWNSVGSK